ncbi:MAG: glycogen/starch/alpha-glucan phosphorylase [Pseudolabrys sp.]|nr:glycogen/starch/alpha-glucan phosphorylase [Pseudolabrys sp.]MDP2296931.1 glycogen/starch/alpha-glucan phosphorylase [Pseudolabrys sp.]
MHQLKTQPLPSKARESHEADGELRDAILAKLTYSLGKSVNSATDNDWYQATALAVRDRVVDVWIQSRREAKRLKKRRVYYLSIEFLIGRLLFDTLTNMRLVEPTRRALAGMGVDLERLRNGEPDAALGNGGLGRLAACFMDSMSALGIPAYGYGIRYENGLFEQRIVDGWQHEVPEDWLANGNPWEFIRADTKIPIGFGGSVEFVGDTEATMRAVWMPAEIVLAVPYDTPIAGWRGRHANALRLWSARVADPIHLATFNEGDLVGATAARARAEAISRVLYPNDGTAVGQELRLRQEYFFTSATLQDLTKRHLQEFDSLENLADQAAIQLNDTHPAIAVAELMRILVDEHEIAWPKAWAITRATLSYTNHTLLPEALESWPVDLLGRLLPRHLQIIYTINLIHLQDIEKRGLNSPDFIAAVSLVDDTGGERRVRMAHLAFVGTHCVNGVSALHTGLLRETVFHDLVRATPDSAPTRVINKTNGITFRRWLYEANPPLTALLVDVLGERVLDDPGCLKELEKYASDENFIARYEYARTANKSKLAGLLQVKTRVRVDPHAMFDVQIKRVHEYKRQLLNLLETIALYQDIRERPQDDFVPRVKIFAGKAAASYERAKLIIKLAGDIGQTVNNDAVVAGRLKLVFVPNYSASLAEAIIPAADLSEQISTAGMEASGTGNMKLALNGAITIGTLDGANIEICDHVGRDNVVIFGMTAAEVTARVQAGFTGNEAAAASPRLTRVLESLAAGEFSPDDPDRYASIVGALRGFDRFMVAADFDSYWDAQRTVDRLWRTPHAWWRASILNTARMGWFSSDRTIREYAREIWNVPVA